MYEYKAFVKRVIDGDTCEVIIDLGFSITFQTTLRFSRIDAYEKTLRSGQTEAEKALGLAATAYLANLIEGQTVTIQTSKQGKYGRYLAEIIYQDTNINDSMVKLGYAHYTGG